MSPYGCYVKFTARPGQRDTLVEHLLNAAAGVSQVAGCELYLINTSPTEPESVWVTEVWRSQEEHDASLTIPAAQAAIKQVLPILAGPPEKIDVQPVGGKGLNQTPPARAEDHKGLNQTILARTEDHNEPVS